MKQPIILIALFLFSPFCFSQIIDNVDISNEKDGDFTAQLSNFEVSGTVKKNQKTANWTAKFPNGMLYEFVQYNTGQREGIYFLFDRSGYIEKQANYVNDKLEGELSIWKPGGRMMLLENYSKGELDGVRKVFYERGSLQEESFYKAGLREGKTSWFDEESKLIATYNYKDGLFDGVQQTYYSNGNVKSSRTYVINKLHGKAKDYREDGTIYKEANYIDNKIEGNWIEFDENAKQK